MSAVSMDSEFGRDLSYLDVLDEESLSVLKLVDPEEFCDEDEEPQFLDENDCCFLDFAISHIAKRKAVDADLPINALMAVGMNLAEPAEIALRSCASPSADVQGKLEAFDANVAAAARELPSESADHAVEQLCALVSHGRLEEAHDIVSLAHGIVGVMSNDQGKKILQLMVERKLFLAPILGSGSRDSSKSGASSRDSSFKSTTSESTA